jgi:hypothetical protein
VPALDLGPEPEHRPARTQVDDRARHVGITRLILADGIAVTQPEDFGDITRIDEIVHEHSPGHAKQLTPASRCIHPP